MFIGKEIGHASALDMAALAFAAGARLGFLQGYIVYEAENLPVEGYMPFIKSVMPVLEMGLSRYVGTIRAKDYDNAQAALDAGAPCPRELISSAEIMA